MNHHLGRLERLARREWAVLRLAVGKFFRIDGPQWAGAFAFNAFFSLFPLIVLFVTGASIFIDRERAGKAIISFLENYVPLSREMQGHIFDTIAGVIQARGPAGAIALLILLWAASQCFITLVFATNRAWGGKRYNWWRLPLKSLVLLGTTAAAILLGIVMPVLMKIAKSWFLPGRDIHSLFYALGNFLIPLLVVFLGLSLFYKLAPRQFTRFGQVWVPALFVAVLLRVSGNVFAIYLKNFATLNAVYGAFGGIMALLLWIYLSGCIFIFGACLCAGQDEERSTPAKTMQMRKRRIEP
jgi:YihY family inner membrane protein